jgi:Ser/Thr protein kinase RdoA (MazF antagonist)
MDLSVILRQFDIVSFTAVPLRGNYVYSVETATGDFVLKKIKKHDLSLRRIVYAQMILRYLSDAKVPVALPVQTKDGNTHIENEENFYVLTHKLPNSPPDFLSEQAAEMYTDIGRNIANLNSALAVFPYVERDWWHLCVYEDFYQYVIPMLDKHISNNEYRRILALFMPLQDEMREVLKELPMQLTHGDCHPANVCILENRVTGFIDFDLLPIGPRLYDICYYLFHILTFNLDIMDNEEKTKKFLSLCPYMIEGYDSADKLSVWERRAFWFIWAYIPIRYFYHKIESRGCNPLYDLRAFRWVCANKEAIIKMF